jgi:hypothetical protein
VRIRKNRGRDILGACGQLAAEYPLKRFTRTIEPRMDTNGQDT